MIVLQHEGLDGVRRGPAVFLDRDGTVIYDVPTYVRTNADARILPSVVAGASLMRELNLPVVIVSNQSAVGRGLLSLESAIDVHNHVVDLLRMRGFTVHLSILCPHTPTDRCSCRKPSPGMLKEGLGRLRLEPNQAYMVGDAGRDVEAAQRAGVTPVLVRTGRGKEAERWVASGTGKTIEVVNDLAAAARVIRRLTSLDPTCSATEGVR